MTGAKDAPVVRMVVSVGTDHHRFDRLIAWVDRWLSTSGAGVECLVQFGSSSAPTHARGVDRMPRETMIQHYESADVVIVQGGPGSILDAREAGKIPIAVPRVPELNEVVDRHQIAFTQAMVLRGDAVIAQSYEELTRAIEDAINHPQLMTTAPRRPDTTGATDHFALALDLANGGRLRSVRRLRQLAVRRRTP